MFFVRSASGADLAKVSALLGRAWHAGYDALYGADTVTAISASWQSVDALKTRLAKPDSEFVVADDGKQLGGMAYAAMDKDEGDVVILEQLCVDPQVTGQGVGRDLFAEVETCFPNAKRMRLEIDPNNESAMRFYAGLGFHEVGFTKNFGGEQSGIAGVILEKAIEFEG